MSMPEFPTDLSSAAQAAPRTPTLPEVGRRTPIDPLPAVSEPSEVARLYAEIALRDARIAALEAQLADVLNSN